MVLSIAEAVRIRADFDLHSEFLHAAQFELRTSLEQRPRIDNGEWTIYAQGRIDAMQEYFSEKTGVPLRRITIDLNDQGYFLRLEPLPHLSITVPANG